MYVYIAILIFWFIRNNYTYKRRTEAEDLVYEYVKKLNGKEYDWGRNYYKEMLISYDKYLFSLNLWGEYSAIKPQYKNVLL